MIGYCVEWQDVTERLRQSAILRALDSQQVMVEFDPSWRVTGANEKAVELAAGGRSAFEKRQIEDILSIPDMEIDEVKRRLESGRNITGRIHLAVGDCRLVLDGGLSPIRNDRGEARGYVLLATDVTQATAQRDR